jgi:hypothetical protein
MSFSLLAIIALCIVYSASEGMVPRVIAVGQRLYAAGRNPSTLPARWKHLAPG